MHFITVTRFNQKTWDENVQYRRRHEYQGCLYGSPRELAAYIKSNAPGFVIEMNNSAKRIEGVGFIRNKRNRRRCKVYSAGNYNRYVYNSPYRVDRADFRARERVVIQVLERLVFYGRSHLQLGHGLTRLPIWIQKNPQLRLLPLLYSAFRSRFPGADIGSSPVPARKLRLVSSLEDSLPTRTRS